MKKISLSESEVKDLLDLYQSEIDRAQRRINNLKTIIEKLSEEQALESADKNPVKPKSKRGRKPNAKPTGKKVVSDVKEIVLTNDEVKIEEPKQRGRKKKVIEVKAEPQKRGRKKKTVEVKPEPQKRGRKKKVVKVEAPPKKRGRKPKSLRKPIKGGKGESKVRWNDFIVETITSKNSLMLASSLTQAALEKFKIPASDRDRVRMAISTTLTKMANKNKVLKTFTQKGIRGAFFGLPSWFNEKNQLNNDYKKRLM